MADTIFALSSGSPPAAIAVVRLSGPATRQTLETLGGALPEPRNAVLRTLRDRSGAVLDRALVLWFPGPASATGEDCGEFHLHGGRAVVAAVLGALDAIDGLRAARAGEFTRRCFENGRIDLAEADALADLLSAETELQRQIAQAGLTDGISKAVRDWRDRVLMLSAAVEGVLDFSDEEDAADLPSSFFDAVGVLADEIGSWLERPAIAKVRDGIRVAIAGPPNFGKSSLFNAILQENAAIVSERAGTTRDVLQRSVAIDGVPFVLIDTAGLRDETDDEIEQIGIARAEAEMARADIVLWLGPESEGPSGSIEVQPRQDDPNGPIKRSADLVVSSVTGFGLDALFAFLTSRARQILPKPGVAVANERQRQHLDDAYSALNGLVGEMDLLVIGEQLRAARVAFDRLLGNAGTEDMLSTLFGRFCIGK